ncbi:MULTISPECIES: pur operon repressor [Floricoccus]|nr:MULTISPECIES: pur operon repressor [Floricoccus]URZ87613.1 pur operon repressor [Floricoccus penangensis]
MKRSERLVDFTNYLLNNPNQLTSLTFFSNRYNAAKSSISEDLLIIKKIFEESEVGIITTYAGVSGGVVFTPGISNDFSLVLAKELLDELLKDNRILPGGYIYLSDLLGDPRVLKNIGKIIAHEFRDSNIDAIMTIATKGVPIAQSVAEILGVPFVIARRDPKITEGATVSVNYMSGSSARVEKMTLSKRSLKSGSNVLLVDDFMKGGGTFDGMRSLVSEFDCQLAGIAVLAEGVFNGDRQVEDYKSILKVEKLDIQSGEIQVSLGNIYNKK